MKGGAGIDVFRWLSVGETSASAQNADVVLDFNHRALERLDLARIDADALAGGNQAFSFIGRAQFTGAGQVRYEIAGSEAHVLLNTDADLEAEGLMRLAKVQILSRGDFFL